MPDGVVAPASATGHDRSTRVVLDGNLHGILVMGSVEGGVPIEQVVQAGPDAIVRPHTHPPVGLPYYREGSTR